MHQSVLAAFERGLLLTDDEIRGKKILEVGSGDVNGSIRPIVEAHEPASYLGVDGAEGPRVDQVVDCEKLVETFVEQFDVVITTEMLEHVRDWQACVKNLVGITAMNGLLVITTRSPGFPYHGFPEDHWRYSVPVMRQILETFGLDVLVCEEDPEFPGVFAKARRGPISAVKLTQPILDKIPVERMTKPLTILGYPHQADGSGYYRFYLPYKHLARGTQHRILLPEPGTKFTPEDDQLPDIDVIAVQRFMGADGVMLSERWKGKTRLVYETDDDILNPDNASGLVHLHSFEIKSSFIRCLELADMVTVSTPALAEEMSKYNGCVRVLPNYIHADMLYVDRPRRDKVTVGWAGGMSHLQDWMEAADPVRNVLTDDVDMHFVGIDYSPLLKRECRFTPWAPQVWDYFRAIDFDIGLAPLADTKFNRSKSHIKALEYMALAIPVIASDREPYRDLVVDGVTGFLVRTEDEWAARLTELINDEAMRTEMGTKGREVASNWTIQHGWKVWRDAYEEVTGWQQ